MGSSINFYTLFKKCDLPQELHYVIDSCEITDVGANRTSRTISMTLHFFKMVKRQDVEKVRKAILDAYELRDVKMRLCFSPELFGEDYSPILSPM
jgi:hypothetical protein